MRNGSICFFITKYLAPFCFPPVPPPPKFHLFYFHLFYFSLNIILSLTVHYIHFKRGQSKMVLSASLLQSTQHVLISTRPTPPKFHLFYFHLFYFSLNIILSLKVHYIHFKRGQSKRVLSAFNIRYPGQHLITLNHFAFTRQCCFVVNTCGPEASLYYNLDNYQQNSYHTLGVQSIIHFAIKYILSPFFYYRRELHYFYSLGLPVYSFIHYMLLYLIQYILQCHMTLVFTD